MYYQFGDMWYWPLYERPFPYPQVAVCFHAYFMLYL
jgi:hypothetical protein